MIIQEKGFTLLEMLLALLIFAALSISAFQVLQGGVRNDEISKKKAQRLAELQGAFTQIEDDFSHIISRRSQGSKHSFSAASYLLDSEEPGVSFVRNSWQNPFGILPRSELQNVGYRLWHYQLERLSYTYADQPVGEALVVKTLLSNVTAFRLRFFANGVWQEHWDNIALLPQGIEVTLSVSGYGDLTRLFLINEGNYN
ncbi:type II secretion system minor pseudopilin GspJ [Yersinia enterocolitica]|uniref:type II secretion system minor pseudopilin GspJ n=1 Tax=Yersinia enterocolitica TaxID=630 RepID=UPI003AB5BA12